MLCAVLLAGCDSIKDVREEPFTAIPQPTAVLQGTITGLGNARPVSLSYDGQPNCMAPDPVDPAAFVPAQCRFSGVAGQNEVGFSFGSLQGGTPYTVTVTGQPYGKVCSVQNATGEVGGSGPPPVVTCTNSDAVPRHDLTVNVDPAIQALPNLKIGVTTEEHLLEQDATGLASVTFPQVLFDTGTSLPQFSFKVRATTETTEGGEAITNYCTFAQTPEFSLGGQNINALWTQGNPNVKTDSVVVPTGPVVVTVNACEFTVTTTVQYHGTPAPPMPATESARLRTNWRSGCQGLPSI